MRKVMLIIVAIFFMISCNKEYPDGGKYFRSDERLLGNWTLTEFSVNGVDSLSILDPKITAENALHIYRRHSSHAIASSVPLLSIEDRYGYTINYMNSGSRMNFSNASVVTEWPFQIPPNDWEILELTKTEVKLKITFAKEYVMVWNK